MNIDNCPGVWAENDIVQKGPPIKTSPSPLTPNTLGRPSTPTEGRPRIERGLEDHGIKNGQRGERRVG